MTVDGFMTHNYRVYGNRYKQLWLCATICIWMIAFLQNNTADSKCRRTSIGGEPGCFRIRDDVGASVTAALAFDSCYASTSAIATDVMSVDLVDL
jgi:hypothetical protein